MNHEAIRQMANRLRVVPLPEVLRLWGAHPDRRDKSKWHTSRGTLSVNGAKFINWNCDAGGGGAIDLVIHLAGECSFREALHWLHTHFDDQLPLEFGPASALRPAQRVLSLPAPAPAQLRPIQSYLVTQRALAPSLLDPLIASGTLYADHKANAVFLLLAKEAHGANANADAATVVGAELRGTGSIPWRGMAPGSRKDHGYFSISPSVDDDPRPIILCESAIDAISCLALHPGHLCISTSGARPNPAWLQALIDKNPNRPIYCGYDADDTGDRMARAMGTFHPEIQRLRPVRHDWNDLLRSRA